MTGKEGHGTEQSWRVLVLGMGGLSFMMLGSGLARSPMKAAASLAHAMRATEKSFAHAASSLGLALGTAEGSFDGKRTTLNGAELLLSGAGVLPSLEPQRQAAEAALELAPLSVAFVAIPGANASACI